MPTLEFKGKPFVYSHHLSVPFRELIVKPDKSLPAKDGAPSLDDNLIIHGDNLEALKALLPRYAGKVDVIYIDPPYNTGNEGWAYNDNVNAPALRAWLGKVVDADDLERHDKWLCMMWPRLQLLRELLSPTGMFFASCDENEVSNLMLVLDEIFGRENRIETLIWKKSYGGGAKEKHFVTLHEYILAYAFDVALIPYLDRPINDEKIARYYTKKDEYYETRGPYRLKPLEATKSMEERENLRYAIQAPDGSQIWPKRQWWWSEDRFKATLAAGGIEFLTTANGWSPQYKQYLKVGNGENRGEKPFSIIEHPSVFAGPYTQVGTAELREIMDGECPVPYPKPSELVRQLVEIAEAPEDRPLTVLDSFAGSGTTAHAVLALNEKDGGNRKFILVETEEYADTLTAERVRRVINGVPDAKDKPLKAGLGGSFAYCELGEPMDLERFFAGKGEAPSWEAVARYVAYTATGETLAPADGNNGFAGYAGEYRLHLLYQPDSKWMRSNEAMLDLTTAERISEAAKADGDKPVLVFAAGKLMGQRTLTELGITFCQLPYSVHRILGDGTEGVAGVDAA